MLNSDKYKHIIMAKSSMNIQNQTNNRFGRRNRQRQRLKLLLVVIFCLLAWSWIYIVNGLRRGDAVHWSDPSSSVEDVDTDHPMSFSEDIIAKDDVSSTSMQEPNRRIESVVAFLMNLAKLPPQQLWDTFGMDKNEGRNGTNRYYGKDLFSLHELEQGQCPSGLSTAEWLPPRPWNSEEISLKFQSRVEELKAGRGLGKEEQTIMIWYEHISKAGGTSFCGLSKTNLGQSLVPRYFCMPKRLNSTDVDGRVGAWSNEELIGYTRRERRHILVANEWDPFDLVKLQLSGRTLEGKKLRLTQDTAPRLLFVTTLRDPLDRLLSAYLFFGKVGDNPKSKFGLWVKRNFGRLGRYRVGETGAFRSNVARYNAIVWRFSGGALQHVESASSDQQQESEFPPPMKDEKLWKDPFETAIRALSQHDLILPMDLMSKEEGQDAMRHILGWNEFAIHEGKGKGDRDSGHIVTTGKIQNSNAKEHFSNEGYRFLWDANWLDNILVLWCRAVFLARLHCNDV